MKTSSNIWHIFCDIGDCIVSLPIKFQVIYISNSNILDYTGVQKLLFFSYLGKRAGGHLVVHEHACLHMLLYSDHSFKVPTG